MNKPSIIYKQLNNSVPFDSMFDDWLEAIQCEGIDTRHAVILIPENDTSIIENIMGYKGFQFHVPKRYGMNILESIYGVPIYEVPFIRAGFVAFSIVCSASFKAVGDEK